jgi:DNA processing protein
MMAEAKVPTPSAQIEDPIIAHLSNAPVQLDDLIRTSGLAAGEVMSRLTLLELQGLVRELPGKFFLLAD